MKRLCPLLLCLALLLGGCGKDKTAEEFQSFSDGLNERRDLRFTAELRAEYPDRSLDFTLSYAEDEDGCTVSVLAPDMIRGVKAKLRPDGSSLAFDSVMLDTGDLDRYGLSPLSALPTLTEALRHGHLESHWSEDGMTVLELSLDDHMRVQVWLDDGMIPCHAELISDGRVSVFCEISDWR